MQQAHYYYLDKGIFIAIFSLLAAICGYFLYDILARIQYLSGIDLLGAVFKILCIIIGLVLFVGLIIFCIRSNRLALFSQKTTHYLQIPPTALGKDATFIVFADKVQSRINPNFYIHFQAVESISIIPIFDEVYEFVNYSTKIQSKQYTFVIGEDCEEIIKKAFEQYHQIQLPAIPNTNELFKKYGEQTIKRTASFGLLKPINIELYKATQP